MLTVQVIPRAGQDAYKLLRDKVTHEARTWSWKNRAKTRIQHRQIKSGYIKVGRIDSILVAQIHPRESTDLFFLTEKFIGRLTAWFADELAAINMQFTADEARPRKRKKRSRR